MNLEAENLVVVILVVHVGLDWTIVRERREFAE